MRDIGLSAKAVLLRTINRRVSGVFAGQCPDLDSQERAKATYWTKQSGKWRESLVS
jgi:hypothetical protein